MITIPERLFHEPFIQTHHRSRASVLLEKRLTHALENRESYVSMHAFSMVLKGTQEILAGEGQRIQVAPGQIGILPQGLYTVTDLLNDQEGFHSFHLYLSPDRLREILRVYPEAQPAGTSSPTFLQSPLTPQIRHLLHGLEGLQALDRRSHAQILSAKVEEIIHLMVGSHAEGHFIDQLRALGVKKPLALGDFMRKHYNKPLKITDFAYLSGRSLSTFQREFKGRFGLSPRQWIIQERVKRGRELLEAEGLSVAEAAHEVGYEKVSHFISAFKAHFGQTPGQYSPHSSHIS